MLLLCLMNQLSKSVPHKNNSGRLEVNRVLNEHHTGNACYTAPTVICFFHTQKTEANLVAGVVLHFPKLCTVCG